MLGRLFRAVRLFGLGNRPSREVVESSSWMALRKKRLKPVRIHVRGCSRSFLTTKDKIQHLVKTVSAAALAVQTSEPSCTCELVVMALAGVGVRA